MTTEKRDIASDRAMCKAATEGSWTSEEKFVAQGEAPGLLVVSGEDLQIIAVVGEIGEQQNYPDTRFIAESREALPHYIDRCETAEAKVRVATEILASVHCAKIAEYSNRYQCPDWLNGDWNACVRCFRESLTQECGVHK